MVGGTKEAAIVCMRDHRTSCSDTASNRRLSLLKQLLSSVFNRTRCTSQTLYFPDCPLRVTNALSQAASIYSGTDRRPQPADPLPSQSTGCTTSRRLQRCLRRRGHNVAVQAPELPAAHFIRINTGARADLMWWHTFLQDWNGTSFFPATTTSMA